MRIVSPFEANLLRILHCLLGRAPLAQALPLMVRTDQRPPCLGRDAVELVKDALAKGCVAFLAHAGGWHRDRFLNQGEVKQGRLWERTDVDAGALEFSPATMDFLMWITANNATSADWPVPQGQSLTTGDQFLLFLAFHASRATEVAQRWCRHPSFTSHGLCALFFADECAEYDARVEPDFDPWVRGPGAVILEALQDRLARRWFEMEVLKSKVVSPQRMQRIGNAQEAVLGAFLDAVDRAGRRDLARFLLVAARQVTERSAESQHWIGQLDVAGMKISARVAVYREAFALLRQLKRLQLWQQQALATGYFDEGYQASQLWKSYWEQCQADRVCEMAASIVRASEPLGA